MSGRTIDRRALYYLAVADLIAVDPLDFYTRAVHGRYIQARIQPKDLTLERLLSMGRKSGKVLRFRRKA